jgi:hypothetical protein
MRSFQRTKYENWREDGDATHVSRQHAVAELRHALLMDGQAVTGDTDRAHTPAGTATRGGESTSAAIIGLAMLTCTIGRTVAEIGFAISR